MNVTQALAPHLPYLRRYARALTGSQSSGDRYVRAALNAILTGEQALTPSIAPRVALYQLFHSIWLSASGHLENDIRNGIASTPLTPQERLLSLDAEQRAVLILTAVEGFRLDEAAAIVGGTPDEVELALV